MESRNIVIGATGGIGRAVVKALTERGETVSVIIRNREKAEKYFSEFPNIEIIEGNAFSSFDIEQACLGKQNVFYCCNIPYPEWKYNAKKLLRISLHAAIIAKAKFILPGNVYVYGHAQTNPVTENHPWNAHTRKGKIRIEMENIIKERATERNGKYCIVRFPDFYGPYVVNNFSEKLYINAKKGKKLLWLGNPKTVTEYVFVEDAGKALVEAALSNKNINQEFNFPSNSPCTNKEYLSTIIKVSGKNSKTHFLNSNVLFFTLGLFNKTIYELKEMLYLKREKLVLDGHIYKSTFGYSSETDLETGVKKTFEWVNNFFK
ncbi:MAG: SDR family NAD(P)-dependent oxidoreductase [Melioribacteraceae bacterium]|nr:SDR family NAD(P)-dependent oxidoreductase [Melioribacteraceae bacterium]